MSATKVKTASHRRLTHEYRRLLLIIGCLVAVAVAVELRGLSAVGAYVSEGAQLHIRPHRSDIATKVAAVARFFGDANWQITKPAHGLIQGYTTATSFGAGDTIPFYVSSNTSTFSAQIFRLGYYGGDGAALVDTINNLVGSFQPTPAPAAGTGLVDPNWRVSFMVTVTPAWPGGLYLARLTNARGYQTYVPFVVHDRKPAKLLLVDSLATDQAYNTWGGNSLYSGSDPGLSLRRAVKVSYNRPYSENNGAGFCLTWEYPLVRFMEEHDYSVDYATDLDISQHPSLLKQYKAIVIAGHDEYWDKAARDGYLAAVASGVNLAVFAANTAYRPIRLESSVAGVRDGIIVDYKDPALDPETVVDPGRSTPAAWRFAPTDWPEQTLLGSMYSDHDNSIYPWVVTDASNWVFAGSGLKNGSSIPSLVGYESDRVFTNVPAPAHDQILSRSPVKSVSGYSDISNSTIYTAPSGAMVFNAGTVQWSWGLDPSLHPYIASRAIQTITANILSRFQQ